MTTTRRNLPGVALAFYAAILLACPTLPLLADDVTFQFTTTINAGPLGGAANTSLTLTYTFDSESEPDPNSTPSFYPTRMTLQVGDQSVTASGPGLAIYVGNNWGDGTEDGYDVRFDSSGAVSGQIFGMDVAFFRFILADSDGTMLTSPALPLSPAFASGTDFIQIDLYLFDSATGEYINLGFSEQYNTPPELKTPFSLTSIDDPTPAEQIADLKLSVQAFVNGGVSLPANGKSLQAKLDAAFNANNAHAAIGSLDAFINQVKAYVRNGKLTPAQGQGLIDAALMIILDLAD